MVRVRGRVQALPAVAQPGNWLFLHSSSTNSSTGSVPPHQLAHPPHIVTHIDILILYYLFHQMTHQHRTGHVFDILPSLAGKY